MRFNQLPKPGMKRYEKDTKCLKVTQYEILLGSFGSMVCC